MSSWPNQNRGALRPSRVTSPLNVLTSSVIDGCCWHYDVRHGGTFWSFDIYVTVNMSWHTCASTLLTCKFNVNYDVFTGHSLQRIEDCNRNFNIYCHNSVHYISNYTPDFKYFTFKCVMIVLQSCIHSLVFSLRGRAGRNQSPVMWPVWLWHTASWASSWG